MLSCAGGNTVFAMLAPQGRNTIVHPLLSEGDVCVQEGEGRRWVKCVTVLGKDGAEGRKEPAGKGL